MLPQIKRKRVFEYTMAVDGLKQILWGLFAKVAVADQLARYSDDIFQIIQSTPAVHWPWEPSSSQFRSTLISRVIQILQLEQLSCSDSV